MTDLTHSNSHTASRIESPRALRVLGSALSTVWLVAKDCRNGLFSKTISFDKALETVYVEPYQATRQTGGSASDKPQL